MLLLGTSWHPVSPARFCTQTYPQLPSADLVSFLQSQPTRRQQRSQNIFFYPSPLASLACAEVSLFCLHDIYERYKLSLGHLQHLAWKRGYSRQPFMAFHFITQAKVILHLCQELCLNVWGYDKCLVQKTTSKGKNVIFFLMTGMKRASEK